jgi:hypothetical protein
VSNVALSLGEDLAVVGGSALAFLMPVVALVVFTLVLIGLWLLLPRLFRLLRGSLRAVAAKWRSFVTPKQRAL